MPRDRLAHILSMVGGPPVLTGATIFVAAAGPLIHKG